GGGFANVQADAFTTVLTAYAQVICGESYHIKIVIGDAMDNLYDSWVYLEAGSFQSNILSMSYTAPNYSSPIDGGVYEGCQAGNLVFTRSGNVDNELSYNLTFGGDAIIGSDINFPYSSIVFPAGDENVTLTFQAIQDLILEGVEVLEITMENAGCGSNNATLEINVYDLPALEVTVDDALINCGETATFTPSITGGLGDYTVVWPGGFEGASYTVAPTSATTYSFTVSDTCGVIPFNGLAAVNFIQNPTLVVEAADDMSATCLDVQNFQPQISGGLPPYSTAWYVNGVLQSVNTNLLFSSNESVALELEVTDFCGVSVSDVFNYDVPAVPIEIDLGSNLSVQCIDEVSYTVAPSGGVGTYSYDWFIDGAFNSSTASFSHYFFSDAIVSIEVSDQCGNTANDQVNIAVPAVPVQVLLPEDITTNCLVTSTVVPTVTGGVGNIDFEWTVNGANYSTNTTINYTTLIDVQIALSVEDECDNSASDVMSILIPPAPISVL
ncbi:MAG: choice-of-anchor L domain-containing protein, partial [Flavobacteriales bacterium]